MVRWLSDALGFRVNRGRILMDIVPTWAVDLRQLLLNDQEKTQLEGWTWEYEEKKTCTCDDFVWLQTLTAECGY